MEICEVEPVHDPLSAYWITLKIFRGPFEKHVREHINPVTPLSLLREARSRLGTAKLTLERRLHEADLLGDAPLTFPDFLGIGAQKSGTTWLNANLRSHPDIFLTEEELHYFDWNYWTPLRHYSEVFSEQDAAVSGEITPGYSILPVHRIRLIHALRPDLKLIFLMRDPIERAWSQARMNLVKLTDREYDEVPDEKFLDHFTQSRSLKRGDSLQILENWLTVFPEDQLHVDFFARIDDDPQGLLKDVFSFLGVTTDVDWKNLPYNEVIFSGPKRKMPAHLRSFLEDLYAADLRRLHDRFGDPVRPWLEAVSDPPS
jgi:hypothetical protein